MSGIKKGCKIVDAVCAAADRICKDDKPSDQGEKDK
jgi:hypothetical protein